ncbi:Uncharacterised protein [Chryseobacterium taklimakanense]|uniref:Uncharacterized protein n=1 Tax=Chryseobacterium taklimakanense TaxID=536441 RepID=A0A239WDD5_9FLAO|nr:hypothetical protein [Chryseobacterium taklimakanense]SNV32086.1 Uncharacterised protein [Chryseobacterium taklimakanense]
MQILIDELKLALKHRLFYSALNNSLIIPDICSALTSENGQTNGTKYKEWFDRYCAQKYNGFVSGEDIYKIRCALLHQGKLNHDYPNFEKILFQIPNENNIILHNNKINNSLNLSLENFVNDVVSGYEKWWEEHNNDQIVLKNLENSINYYPNGMAPFIVGIPLIC